jgi:hypothetical protein
MSTSADTERWPLRSRRCFIQSGVAAFQLRITRPEKRPHRSGAEIFTGSFSALLTATGGRSALQRHAGQGRHFARHAQHRQAVRLVRGQLDGELEVVQRVVVAEVLADRRVVRQFQQAAALFRQLQFLGRAQHALRLDAAQLADLDFKRLAIGARRQHGASHGAHHFQARAHIRRAADDVEQVPVPTSTWQTFRRSAFGCFHFAHVADHHVGERRRDRFHFFHFQAGHGQQMGQFVRSHLRIDHGTEPVFGELHIIGSSFMLSMDRLRDGTAVLVELLQETQVAFVEQAQVVDPVAQHGQALQAGAERETDVLLRIQAEIAHHVGAPGRAGHFQPAAFQRTAAERDVDLGRRFGEREVRRTEAHLQVVGLEEGLDEVQVHALQVGKADVLGDPQAFTWWNIGEWVASLSTR